MRHKKGSARVATGGFTLIELLVAVSISAVLAGLLVVVTRNTLDLWEKAQDRSFANVQASVALNLLTQDLQSTLTRVSESTLALNILPASALGAHNWRTSEPLLKPDWVNILTAAPDPLRRRYIEHSRFGRGGVWLRFLGFNLNPDGSLPQAISYQIVRRPMAGGINATNPPPIRYILFRHYTTPDDTFATGYDISSYDALLARPAVDQALCDNVVDFGVWCYRRESDGSLTVLYPQSPDSRDFLAQPGSSGATFPDVVEVMLRVMTERGAAQLEQMELGLVTRPPGYASDEEWWWAQVLAESRVYSTRILLNRPEGL
ncbi:PulJ/GspJ family protein [Cephaloticoccus capnophilus]|nr:prepilin-type N-terminal cleavage/methylation domain-containing protein [Cephaloticoccus capnophilus]